MEVALLHHLDNKFKIDRIPKLDILHSTLVITKGYEKLYRRKYI